MDIDRLLSIHDKNIELVENPKLVFKEKGNRQELRISNPNNLAIHKIKVDGGVITDQSQKKCDFLMYIAQHNKCKVYFIELKGSHISEAVKQIESTIDIFRRDFGLSQNESLIAYIVCNKCPLATSEIQKISSKMRKDFKTKLVVKKSPLEDTV